MVAGIHVLPDIGEERRGWPGQARPWRQNNHLLCARPHHRL